MCPPLFLRLGVLGRSDIPLVAAPITKAQKCVGHLAKGKLKLVWKHLNVFHLLNIAIYTSPHQQNTLFVTAGINQTELFERK